ncbi:PAS domain-containing sensor histidine kinase [Qaidamihabitans albus]|uniref:PAS domain-containing sensor histidine kinase n=1 Tax=Qaidamihabitans albus TaxID=2795733 RepID=UPI0018F1A09E|nr:histidine kinase [Qaidamihabitans albus]
MRNDGGPTIDDRALRTLLDVSADGLAVLDGEGRFVAANPAAAHVLGLSAEELAGQAAPFDTGATAELGPEDRLRGGWVTPGGRRRDLEYRVAPVAGGGYAVWFSDVTDTLRQQERLTAIARTASNVAAVCSLRATLDAVASEVAMTAAIAAVQILTLDNPQDEVRVLGMAGFPDADAFDFTERLSACRRLGARVLSLEAFLDGKPVVAPHRRPAILADPAWEPLHEFMSYPDWDSFVSVPLVARGRTLGVINAYYLPDEDPAPGSLAFLEAMADQAAVAIDTVSLVAQTRSQAQLDARRRLARDLHDSVAQQLFSMRMQAKALRAQLGVADPEPAGLRGGVEELAELSQSALADLRALIFELRPLDLAEHGLVDAVRSHADSVAARTGLSISVRDPAGLEWDAGIDVQEDLYRIIQEALHNVVKHASATSVDIRFGRTADGRKVTVEVTDNGEGAGRGSGNPVADGTGQGMLGLVSMRERIQQWGGTLAAGPGAAGGWTVAVTVPRPGAPGTRTEGGRLR